MEFFVILTSCVSALQTSLISQVLRGSGLKTSVYVCSFNIKCTGEGTLTSFLYVLNLQSDMSEWRFPACVYVTIKYRTPIGHAYQWTTKSFLACVYHGRNKTLLTHVEPSNSLHLLQQSTYYISILYVCLQKFRPDQVPAISVQLYSGTFLSLNCPLGHTQIQ